MSGAPASTYRLQLGPRFTLRDALAVVPYLDRLGVDHVYLSPVLAARAASEHGYDVTDPTRVDPRLGGREALEELAAALHERGMGVLLDIVPNHLAATPESPWWRDVLRHGERSPHAPVFDVDWPAGRGRVIVPTLGEPYGRMLEAGALRLVAADDGPAVRVYEEHYPLDPATLAGASLDELDRDPAARAALLGRQHYRLAQWRLAAERGNYRRFFDISDLVSVRVEDPGVFAATHALVAELVGTGVVDALRVDHVDGLHDPAGYLERLRARVRPPDGGEPYVVVEKILNGGEELRDGWHAAGTTGYEFLNAVTRLQVDPDGLAALADVQRHLGAIAEPFQGVAAAGKRLVLETLFAGELDTLARRLAELALDDVHASDALPSALRRALVELTAALPVYRTYVRDDGAAAAADREAIAEAARLATGGGGRALDFVRRVLSLEADGDPPAGWVEVVLRWQRLTGPVMAKGVEDTALYRHFRLLALNEVGGEPEPPPDELGVQAFHRRNARAAERWPGTLTAASTHDTKRGEDARARLAVLSEVPDEWSATLRRLDEVLAPLGRRLRGEPVPAPEEEALLLQALVGSWPLQPGELGDFRERFHGYVVKALREAKLRTSWSAPDAAFEEALAGWVDDLFDTAPAAAELTAFAERLARAGTVNSLAATALRVAAPGVPDLYWGSELGNLALADPDNRRAVDFAHRAELLTELDRRAEQGRPELAAQLLRDWRSGLVKLWVTACALRHRRKLAAHYRSASYLPLAAGGRHGDRVAAFARAGDGSWTACAAARLAARLGGDAFPVGELWEDTAVVLPAGAPSTWRDVFTGAVVETDGGVVPLERLFAALPVALLEAVEKL